MKTIIKYIVLIVVFITISCGEITNTNAELNFSFTSNLNTLLSNGEIEIKVYKTDKLMSDKVTSLCNENLDLSKITPIVKKIAYNDKNLAKNSIEIKPGYYVVTAVGIVNGEEKTEMACASPFLSGDTKKFYIMAGNRVNVYLELKEKE